jgi:hypothetical protein
MHTANDREGFGDFEIGGQVIRTVKYSDEHVLLAKGETVLQGMIDRLSEVGRCCGMEINVKKIIVMRILRQPSPLRSAIDTKQCGISQLFV